MIKHPLFNNVKLDYSKYLLIKDYPSKSLVFFEKEKCEYLALILEGEIHISTLTYNEKEYTITVLIKYDTFGEFLLFSDDPVYLGDIIASPNTKLALISKDNLLTLLKDQTILQNYLLMLSKRSMANQEKVKIFSRNTVTNVPMSILSVLWKHIRTLMLSKWILSKVDVIKGNVYLLFCLEVVVL